MIDSKGNGASEENDFQLAQLKLGRRAYDAKISSTMAYNQRIMDEEISCCHPVGFTFSSQERILALPSDARATIKDSISASSSSGDENDSNSCQSQKRYSKRSSEKELRDYAYSRTPHKVFKVMVYKFIIRCRFLIII